MKSLFVLALSFILCALSAVGAEPISDDTLYDQVRIKIATDREIGGGKIDVKVTNGVVELTGTVKQERQREKAEKVVKKVKGVKSVDNKLRVGPI